MEWVETTGRTLEEAQDKALDQLGVDELDAEFEVLEEPKSGLFGRVRGEARVRARVRPNSPLGKSERRGGRRRSAGGESAAPASTRPAVRSAPDHGPDRSKAPSAPTRNVQGGPMETVDVPLAEQAEAAGVFLAGLVRAVGANGAIEVHEIDDKTVEVAVVGEHLGLLIGPTGATLAAVQDLTRTAVQRQTGGRNGRLMVDVGGYREKRRSALERFTRQIATQVVETGRSKVLEPMSAADRKVVHDTVNGIDGVMTASEGEDPRRRVVIQPV